MLTAESFDSAVSTPLITNTMNLQPSVSWNDFGNSLLQGVIGGVGSGLLGLGFNALSGLVDSWNYKDQADYAFQLQEKAAKNAYNRQLDFWNLQNQYNDPSNQVKRLKGAGLNPALMNGQAMNNVAGGLSSTPMPGMISPQGRQTSASNFMGTLTTALAQLEQTGFLDAETKLVWQKVLNEKLQEDILKGARDLGFTNLEINKINHEAFYEALFGVGLDGGKPRITNNPYTSEIEELRSRKRYNDVMSEDNIATRNARINELISSAQYTDAKTATEDLLRDATFALTKAKTSETKNAAFNLYKDSLLKDAEIAYKEALTNTTNNEDARKQALHVITLQIEDLKKQGLINDLAIDEYKAELRRIYKEGAWSLEEFRMWFNDKLSNILGVAGGLLN